MEERNSKDMKGQEERKEPLGDKGGDYIEAIIATVVLKAIVKKENR